MKFGKELAAQMVQEWQEAYMDYSKLKLILKDILRFKQQNKASLSTATTKGSFKRKTSLYRAFSGLTKGYDLIKKNEDEVILVEEGGVEGDYQTIFLMSGEEGGEFELLFFRRLDDEFNKVEQVMVEADELSKQMNALIAIRINLADNSSSLPHHHHPINGCSEMDVIQEETEFRRAPLDTAEEKITRAFEGIPSVLSSFI